MIRIGAGTALLLLLPLAACGGGTSGPLTSPGPRTFLFGTRGVPDPEGQFVAATSDPSVLAKVEGELALPASERRLHISGPIAAGGGSNLSWSWHFVPDRWDLVEMSAEVCDGTPAMVESDVEGWVSGVGIFCPWGSYVQSELR